MSELSFGAVMSGIYPEIAHSDNPEAYIEYRAKLKELDAKDLLTEGHVSELVDGNSPIQDRLSGAVDEVLASGICIEHKPIHTEGRSFEPGASVIIAESDGSVHGVYYRPVQEETLLSYGNGLLWAAMKLGDESYALATQGASAANISNPFRRLGYNAVCNALTGMDLQDIPFKDRPHLGGATLDFRNRLDHGNQRPLLHAGVSGVLMTAEALHAVTHMDRTLNLMYEHAKAENAHDGFEGNIFAGSVDGIIGSLILSRVTNTYTSPGVDLNITIGQFSNGVNVH